MKRLMDFVLSVCALVALLPLLLPVAVLLKLTGEHFIFYRQQRIGFGGKSFGLLKFATMVLDSPNLGTGDITVKNDPRVLPLGRILRKTKINELPQILNVLMGDMAVIGPRPLTPKNFEYYSQDTQDVIGKMRPGLSGVGSIVFRDEESLMENVEGSYEDFYRTRISPYKGELEIWYYKNQGLALDVKLILLTLWVVLDPDLDVHRYLKGIPRR
jgi:lipopolysaccharide/colanic/teichoic acid biosynthesis glycosyltransferase